MRAVSASISVHPRVCGERSRYDRNATTLTGSSPRVRGTHSPRCRDAPHRRFIPACAGNAAFGGPNIAAVAVHPRVCGERTSPIIGSFLPSGSSPRVRGTQAVRRHPGPARRFIPACAGNAESEYHRPCPVPVHPRVCGERQAWRSSLVVVPGSSPRVRGTPLRLR